MLLVCSTVFIVSFLDIVRLSGAIFCWSDEHREGRASIILRHQEYVSIIDSAAAQILTIQDLRTEDCDKSRHDDYFTRTNSMRQFPPTKSYHCVIG